MPKLFQAFTALPNKNLLLKSVVHSKALMTDPRTGFLHLTLVNWTFVHTRRILNRYLNLWFQMGIIENKERYILTLIRIQRPNFAKYCVFSLVFYFLFCFQILISLPHLLRSGILKRIREKKNI